MVVFDGGCECKSTSNGCAADSVFSDVVGNSCDDDHAAYTDDDDADDSGFADLSTKFHLHGLVILG